MLLSLLGSLARRGASRSYLRGGFFQPFKLPSILKLLFADEADGGGDFALGAAGGDDLGGALAVEGLAGAWVDDVETVGGVVA